MNEKLKPRICLQTNDFIVVDKPNFLSTIPANQDGLSVKTYYPAYYPVHRLDKETSGLLILAKSARVADHFIQQFKLRKIYKAYLGLSLNPASKSRLQVKWNDFLEKTTSKKRPMKINPSRGLTATTHVEIFRTEKGSLLLLKPHTGRTHQLRVQAEHHGFPLCGDPIYGKVPGKFLFLHACYLKFTGPDKKLYQVKLLPKHWNFEIDESHLKF